MSKVEEIYARATAGDRVAQYDLAVYFGEMSRKVDQREKVDYCLDQVLIWLKKSASQGYAPAKEALNDIQEKFELTEAEKVPEPEPVQPVPQPRKSVQTASTRSDVPRQPRAWVPDTQDSRPAPAAEADDTKPYIPYGAANKPVKKKSKESRLIIIIAAAVCVALIIFGVIKAAKLFTQSSRPGEVADDEQEKQEEQKQEEQEEQDAEKEEKTEEQQPEQQPEEQKPQEQKTEGQQPTEPKEEEKPKIPTYDLSGCDYLDVKPDPATFFPEDDVLSYRVNNDTGLYVRSGPGTDYNAVVVVDNGTAVKALASSEKWFFVSYNGNYGWVLSDYLVVIQ